ncbi:metal-dependent hydrolase, partial [Marinobacter adhaerens]|uniref:metal-dependent hydrolase n=1 Tax=Marinobacter adhaerens TaxID=1033846 RepID=UPI001C5DBD35
LFIGFNLNLLNRTSAIITAIGFSSHIISDALTHKGVAPLWPFKKPRFNGPIKTGGLGEYLIVLVLLLLIYWVGTII